MDPTVETQNGRVSGLRKTSRLGSEYFSFLGIPFAKPPVGSLRFKSPEPAEPWEGVLAATKEKPVPYYHTSHFEGLQQSEDCLYLNVYAKNLQRNAKPVVVFIHGGGYNSGSSTSKMLGPDFLMEKEMILVTFNYRLHVFGLLAFKNHELGVPGNAFLKDQRMALRWVRDNIEAFGGDPNNVTVVGHSVGAASVQHHLVSPGSEGLFSRAILMSGSAIACWGLAPFLSIGEKLAIACGWSGRGGERGALEHLRSLDAETLTTVSKTKKLLSDEDVANDTYYPFMPLIEPYKDNDSFCVKEPLWSLKDCWGNKIDVVFWMASNESLLETNQFVQHALQKGVSNRLMVPFKIRQKMKPGFVEEEEKRIRAIYGNFKDFGPRNYQPLLDFRNDQLFAHPIHRSILARVTYSPAKTFMAYFDIVSNTFNHHKIIYGAQGQQGASHGDELSYIFSNEFGVLPPKESVEFKNVKKIVDLIFNVASQGSSYCESISWNPIQKSELPYGYKALLIQDPDWEVGSCKAFARMPAWDSLYLKNDLY